MQPYFLYIFLQPGVAPKKTPYFLKINIVKIQYYQVFHVFLDFREIIIFIYTFAQPFEKTLVRVDGTIVSYPFPVYVFP